MAYGTLNSTPGWMKGGLEDWGCDGRGLAGKEGDNGGWMQGRNFGPKSGGNQG